MLRRDKVKLLQSQAKKMERYLSIILQCSELVRFQRKEMIQYYNIRGVAHARLNNYPLAMNDFNKGIALLNIEGNSNPELLELFLFNRAMVYLIQQDYVNAAADLRQIERLNQTAAYPCYYQGVICFAQGNKKRALTYYLFALLLDSGKDQQEEIEREDKESQIEFDDRKINFGVLLNHFNQFSSKQIYSKILSLPFEQSIALLQQCKTPETFLGKMCAELEDKEKINFAINYQMLMKMGLTYLFALPSSHVSDKREARKMPGERRALSRSQ